MTSSDDSAVHEFVVDGVDIRTLPKISLHDHLDGSLRPATVLELAEIAQVTPPADNPEGIRDWVRAQTSGGSLEQYLTTFDLMCDVTQTAEALNRVARESVTDLAADGVMFGELRWAPEQHLRNGLTMDAAVEAVQSGIEDGIAEAATVGQNISIGQIVTAMRHAQNSVDVAELALRHRGNGVVGFDIAGGELGNLPSAHRDAFELLANEFLPVTVHAGEADGIESIRSALVDARALRLGHGVRIAEDITLESESDDVTFVTLGHVAQWVKDRGITLELCPSSNLQTGAISQWGTDYADHPFDLLYQLGFCVTVNTDNRLQSDTSLSTELVRLSNAFGYGLDDFEVFAQNAAASAFLHLEEREALAEAISDGFVAAVGASRSGS